MHRKGHSWKTLSGEQVVSITQDGQGEWFSFHELHNGLCSLEGVTTEIRSLWEQVGGLPCLVDAERCFSPAVPSYKDIWVTTARACETDKYDIYLDGDLIELSKNKDYRRELYTGALLSATLIEPQESQEERVKVLNIFSHGLTQKIRLPKELGWTALDQGSEIAANITPPGSITDVHHGKAFSLVD